MKQPLPCIVCGFRPGSIDERNGGSYQPYDATMFSAGSGHYGSTVWDEMSSRRSLEINVCDRCLITHKERVAVAVHPLPQRLESEFIPWDPEADS